MNSEDEPEPNRNELQEDLERAGFDDREIERALDWLDGLNATGRQRRAADHGDSGFRQRRGRERLDAASRGYLLHLEQIGILQPAQRELVIDRLLALDNDEIDVEQTKWVVMMVLFSQPGQQDAYRADGGSRVRRRLGLGPLTPSVRALSLARSLTRAAQSAILPLLFNCRWTTRCGTRASMPEVALP